MPLRSLLKSPGFTALVVGSLAVGFGLITALASLADAILFRPLPVDAPAGIVRLFTVSQGQPAGFVSYPDFVDFRRASRSVSGLIAQSQVLLAVSDRRTTPQVRMGLAVTPDYFDVFGVRPALGCAFRPGEDSAIVLAHAFWQAQYGSDPGVIGRTILLSGAAFQIVGVAPPGFGLDRFAHEDYYLPIGAYANGVLPSTGHPLEERGRRYISVYGRLAHGMKIAQAQAEFAALASHLEQEHRDTNPGRRALILTEFQARTHADRTMPALGTLLLAIAALVLIITCSNVAGLFLVRAEARERETAMCLALGASPARLLCGSLLESAILSIAGAFAGLPLAGAAARLLAGFATLPTDARFSIAPQIDLRAGCVVIAVTALVTLVCGFSPSLSARRAGVATLLRSRTSRKQNYRNALVIAEIALAFALIACGGVLVRAIAGTSTADLGYRAEHVLVLTLDPAQVRYSEMQTRAFYDQLLETARRLPGVRGAALAQSVPLGYTRAQRQIEIEGQPERSTLWMNLVTPGYFGLMRMPLLSGRAFDDRDTAASPPVAIVNEELAKMCGLGARIRMNGRVLEVIGIAKTAKYFQIGEPPQPYFYLPYSQNYASRMTLHVDAAGDLARALLDAVQLIDPMQPVSELRCLRDYVTQGATFNARVGLAVTGGVGIGGLALALAGLYSVISLRVARRRGEIGLRIALGARPVEVMRMIAVQAAKLVAAGIASGMVSALGLNRLLHSLLARPEPMDAGTMALSGVIVGLASLLACLVPAQRAATIEPSTALRKSLPI